MSEITDSRPLAQKIKVLNAFAGFGGNTELLDRDKYHITHVEMEYSRQEYLVDNFPMDIVWRTDAYGFIKKYHQLFDIVWASPPCKTHSRANYRSFYRDFKLYSLIDALQRKRKDKPWIVENTVTQGEDLIKPGTIVARHYIWSNRPVRAREDFPEDNYHPNGIQYGKKWRDRMNPYVGKYLFEQLEIPTLEAWF